MPILFFAAILVISFQNCSQFSTQISKLPIVNQIIAQESGNGGTYDGKPRILHNYVDQFRCEGREAPESVLIQKDNKYWFLIQNSKEKCALLDQVPVSGVIYDDTQKRAQYNSKIYEPPRPYFVLASENPNLPALNPLDGVCADANGKCSLLAAVQQASSVSSNSNVLIHIPAGNYLLTAALPLQMGGSGYSVTLQGDDVATVQLNGQNATDIVRVTGRSGTSIFQNLTFINGYSSQPHHSSALFAYYNGPVNIENCLFSANSNNPAIYLEVMNGGLIIRQSRFIFNPVTPIYVAGTLEFILEDSVISDNDATGVSIGAAYTKALIRRTAIFNNKGVGLSLQNSYLSMLENVSIYNNNSDGLVIGSTITGDIKMSVQMKNSTIYNNGLTSGGSLQLYFFDPINSLTIDNSILATNNANRPNCTWFGNFSHTIVATNSIFDDNSCVPQGTGNLVMTNPLLSPPAMNGGWSPTLLPLAGSPAIDGGDNLTCSLADQRNLARPIDKLGGGARCDIGAVELQ